MAKSLALNDQLCFSIYAAGHAFNRFYKPLLDPLGLTYPQYLVLLALWEADGLAIKTLGQRLDLDSGTLTPLLKRMEKSGLVRRSRSTEDERLVEIHLTETGAALEARAKNFPELIETSSGCSSSELAGLRKKLSRLRMQLAAQSLA